MSKLKRGVQKIGHGMQIWHLSRGRQKKDQYKARRKLRRNTLYKDSIAMVNPFYDSMDDSS